MRNYVEPRYGGSLQGKLVYSQDDLGELDLCVGRFTGKWLRVEKYLLHSTKQERSRGDTNHLGRYEFLMGFTYEFI